TITSDSEDSMITYTTVSSPSKGRSGDVSPGVDGPPVMPENPYAYVVAAFQALPLPDYVPGPEEPEQAPPLPIYIPYVPEPEYPEYIPPEDESDPDEDPEDDDDEDPKEDPANYLTDHDDDDEEEEPSGDDADEVDEEQDEDDDEEEKHLALADSILPPPALRVRESSAAAAARPIEGRRADYGFVGSVEAEIRRSIAEDIGYGIRDTWIDPRDVAEEEALTTLEGVNTRVDSQYHYETSRLVDQEAIVSREAWAHSIGLSSAVHFELQGYMTHTWVQDQRIDVQDALIETLTTQLSSLQGHLATALSEIQALQTREQACTSALEGAGSNTAVIYLGKVAPKRAAPRRTTRLNQGATSNPNQAPSTTTTIVTNAQLQAMIDQGVNAALVARDANRTGDDSHTSGMGVRRTERVTRECTYQDFMKCQPLIVGTDAAYVMTWIELKKKMADKYCPRNEMKKIETALWNLKVQGTDLTSLLKGKMWQGHTL
nr:hypothetical protein [Tanacetum cinerariifolium]